MAKDFSSDQGDIQGVAPNTKAPAESGTPVTGFVQSPGGERSERGPGEAIPPNTRKIR